MEKHFVENIYRLRSFFGKNLILSEDGYIKQENLGAERNNILIYIQPVTNRGYIFSENININIHAHYMNLSSPIFPVDLYKKNNKISLYSCSEKKFFSCHPNDSVTVNVDAVREWEQFELVPFEKNENDCYLEEIINVKESIDLFPRDTYDFKDFLFNNSKNALLGIVANIFCLDKESLQNICSEIIKSPKWIALISEYFCDDIWANQVFPNLISWLADRDRNSSCPKLQHEVGEEFDFLGRYSIPQTGRGLQSNTPVEFLVRMIREMTKPRKDVCILATGRNEGIYYLEWISFYLSIGVNDFFIYTNDNIDKSDILLKKLDDEKIIKYFHSKSKDGVSVQWKAYAHALGVLPDILDYKWTIICDIDEFLVIDRNMFSNIQSYLKFIERRKVENISIPWCCVGASGQIVWNEALFMDRFDVVPFHERQLIKSVFQTRFAGNAHSHFPIELDDYHMTYQNSNGVTLITDDKNPYGRAMDTEPDFRMAVFYHYYFKSIEEFLWKSARNRGDYVKVSLMSSSTFDENQGNFYLENFNESPENPIEMLPDIYLLKEETLFHYKRLLENPEINNINNVLKHEFRKKMHIFIKNLLEEEQYKTLPECYKKLLSIIQNR